MGVTNSKEAFLLLLFKGFYKFSHAMGPCFCMLIKNYTNEANRIKISLLTHTRSRFLEVTI